MKCILVAYIHHQAPELGRFSLHGLLLTTASTAAKLSLSQSEFHADKDTNGKPVTRCWWKTWIPYSFRPVRAVMASQEDVLRPAIALGVKVFQARIREFCYGKKTRKRSVWVQKWIGKRQAQGASDNHLKELALLGPNHIRESIETGLPTIWRAVPLYHKVKQTLQIHDFSF